LREKELHVMCDCAEISHALCDERLMDEMRLVTSPFLQTVITFDGTQTKPAELERKMEGKPAHFENFDTSADDVCLIGFTSGTTGKPKMTAHYHRDVLA
ncbi:MAG TPA: AMP-binding protein, partial [Flavobacterium sp.]|nr:AMP-binding protein [Flavobacterium sp.]